MITTETFQVLYNDHFEENIRFIQELFRVESFEASLK